MDSGTIQWGEFVLQWGIQPLSWGAPDNPFTPLVVPGSKQKDPAVSKTKATESSVEVSESAWPTSLKD